MSRQGGFSITAPADTTVRTFILHVAMSNGAATMTAHLSDGSATDQTVHMTANNASANTDYNLTIVYKASQAHQTLTVTIQQDPVNGRTLLRLFRCRAECRGEPYG